MVLFNKFKNTAYNRNLLAKKSDFDKSAASLNSKKLIVFHLKFQKTATYF